MQLRAVLNVTGFIALVAAVLLLTSVYEQETLVTNFPVIAAIVGSGLLIFAGVIMSAAEIVYRLRLIREQLESNASNNERLARALAQSIKVRD